MTSVVLLIANSMHRPKHGDLSLDSHLVENGLQSMSEMIKETENEALQSFLATCTEMHQSMQQRCAAAAMIANGVVSSLFPADI